MTRQQRFWLTPPDLYAKLDSEFHFDFDPCPFPRPDAFNGIDVSWGYSNYNDAVSSGKVSVDVKPVKRDLSDAEIEEIGAQEAEKRGEK